MRTSLHLFSVLGIATLLGCTSSSGDQAPASTAGTGATGATGGTNPGSGGDSPIGGAGTGATGGSDPTAGTGGTAGNVSAGGSTSAGAPATGGTDASGGVGATAGSAGAPLGGESAGGAGGAGSGGVPAAGDGGTAGSSTAGTSTGGTPGGIKKFIGNIAPKNQDIPANFADKWMQMSMEANSKWGFVQPNGPEDWVWGPVDEAYQYAKDHNIVFKQHNFFWNFEQPSWVTTSNVMEFGEKWVKAFCERYPDVPMIDVVNEPIGNPAPYRSGMGGTGASGFDWVVTAFNWAHQYCPNSILIVNEFNVIEWENDHNEFLDFMQAVLDAGAPIDAIGVQGHDVYRAGTDVAKTYIDVLVQRFNLPVYVTELDIDLSNDAEQLAKMQEEIQMFWDHPNVYGITYWGFLQGSTWRTNAWLVSTNGTERPAMTWLQEFIAAHR